MMNVRPRPARTRTTRASKTMRMRDIGGAPIGLAPGGSGGISYGQRTFPRGPTMSRRTWLFATTGVFALLIGALVFLNSLGAKPKKDDSGDPAARKAGAFDGDRALGYLSTLCDLGPRISGSDAMAKQQDLVQKH